MSGVKGRSGRKNPDVIAKQRMEALYPLAVDVMEIILKAQGCSYAIQATAAQFVIDHKLGKPRERKEILIDMPSQIEITFRLADGSRFRELPLGNIIQGKVLEEAIKAEIEDNGADDEATTQFQP